MANSYSRFAKLAALIGLGLGVSSPSHAGGYHHGYKMVMRGGGGFLAPMGTAGFGTAAGGVFMPSSGFGLASVPYVSTVNPFAVSASPFTANAGPSLASFGMTPSFAPSGFVTTAASVPVMGGGYVVSSPGLVMSSGGVDTSASQELASYQAFRATSGAASGPSLASASPGMRLASQIASKPEYSLVAASVGQQELASIAGYLNQFAGRPEFWQKAFNLFRTFAQYNPWFNLDPLLQGPLRPFLDEIFKGGGGGDGPAPTGDLQEIKESIQALDRKIDEKFKVLEGRIGSIENLTPRLAVNDVVEADAADDGPVAIKRKAQRMTVPGVKGLKAKDIILKIDDEEIQVSRELGAPDEREIVTIPTGAAKKAPKGGEAPKGEAPKPETGPVPQPPNPGTTNPAGAIQPAVDKGTPRE